MRILLATPYYPNDTSFGAGQRTNLLHDALQEVGQVTTLVLREGRSTQVRVNPSRDVLAEIEYPEVKMWRKLIRPEAAGTVIRDLVDFDSFDVIVCRYLSPLLAIPSGRGLVVVDADDAYYRYSDSGTIWTRGLSHAKTRARIAFSRQLLRKVSHSWFCCDRDQRKFRLAQSSVLPNLTNPSMKSPDSVQATEPIVLMVGSLWYGPNRNGIERFLANCWPTIRKTIPGARFRAVGSASPELRSRWSNIAGVECPGFVDDIGIEYENARVTIVPVNEGGGTQIKTLESLAHGRVPVVSSFVASGFAPHLQDETSFHVANNDETMIAHVVSVLTNPLRSVSVVMSGQSILMASFSKENFSTSVRTTIESLSKFERRPR